jgi:hypothetical protein
MCVCLWWACERDLIRRVPTVWNQQLCGAEGRLGHASVSSNKSKNVPLGGVVA